MIKTCLDNNVVYHIQSYATTNDTWDEFLNHVKCFDLNALKE